jgi:putative FmdB family regulatory protein
MPIYEYKCGACGHQLEAMQKFSDEPLKECPTCGKPALNKLISASGFLLKGSGWYVTDYRDKAKPKQNDGAEGNSDSSKNTETSTETKSDSAKSESSKSDSSKTESAKSDGSKTGSAKSDSSKSGSSKSGSSKSDGSKSSNGTQSNDSSVV